MAVPAEGGDRTPIFGEEEEDEVELEGAFCMGMAMAFAPGMPPPGMIPGIALLPMVPGSIP